MRGSGGKLGLSFTGIVGNNTLTSVKLTQPTRETYFAAHWVTQIGNERRAWACHAPYETADFYARWFDAGLAEWEEESVSWENHI